MSALLRSRRTRGALLALFGATGAFLLMANERQLPHGVAWGALALLVCVGGTLVALGLLPLAGADTVPLAATSWAPLPGEPRVLAPRLTSPVALAIVVVALVVVGFDALPVALALALGVLGLSALRRPGLAAFVLSSLLLLPMLGVFGLWDPWETHYGEVAREILARDDWVSLWWAQDKWFWSKPIFIFWAEALVWSASGIDFRPDTNFQHAEWVVRFPTYLVSVAALTAVYGVVARAFGKRAGLCSALVLVTTPYFGFLARQAITDMPFVGCMTVAIVLLVLAFGLDPEREVTRYRVGPWAVSLRELVLASFLMLVLPQILYLATRNVTFVGGLFAWHRDEFLFGSAYNLDVPGNFGLHDQKPWSRAPWLEPISQAGFWLACGAFCVWRIRRETRVQGLVMVAFYLACALAFMGKGIPGFALPGLVALFLLVATGRWSLLGEGRLRIASGALVLTTVALPWFVAMFVRHGPGFTDRLLVHDHLNRLAAGVHGDTGSIAYFIAQLGYGTFPWLALAPAALGSWLVWTRGASRHAASPGLARDRYELLLAAGLWFAATFTLFSAMKTKFHHYMFPAVPPLAVLVGVFVDRLLGPASDAPGARRWLVPLLAWTASVPLVLGVAGLFGDVRGILPAGLSMAERAVWGPRHPWPTALACGLVGAGVALLFVATLLARRRRAPDEADPASGALAVGALAGAVLCAFAGRDLSWTTGQRPAGHERLIQLFIYNYERPFPEHLDYRAILTGFAVVATVLVLGTALRALRPICAHAFVATAFVFSAWSLNVYMIDLTPHWSQRDLVARYYRERRRPDEAFVAWQMNWKGENFYTGNRVAVFVDLDNKKIEEWMGQQQGKRAFVVLEHKRFERFERLAKQRKVKKLTTERDNNKFVLVEVQL